MLSLISGRVEAGGQTFHPVVFHSMSDTLFSLFEGFSIILLLQEISYERE